MTLPLSIASAVLVLFTLLPRWRHPHWLVRGMEFPRLQLAVLAALLLAFEVIWLDLATVPAQGLIAVTALCLLWHVGWIAPYTRIWPCEVASANAIDPDRRIRILTANVLTPNRNAGLLLALVREREPDVLVTLESDQWWQDRLDALEASMPHTIKCPLDNLYGMHVYSRLPLEETGIAYLVEDDKPSMHALVRLRSGDRVRMHFVHPAPPSPTENKESTERDAELVMIARSLSSSDQPAIVTGDLNDVAWSATTRLFRKLSGLCDPRVGRGMFNTFHADYPFLRFPLDHVFHSEEFTLGRLERLPPIGSDHFPLFAELWFTPTTARAQDGLEADASDRARGQSITAQADVDAAEVPRPGD